MKVLATRPFNYNNKNARVWKITTRGKLAMQFNASNKGKSVTLYTGWREVSFSGATTAVASLAAIGAASALLM